MEDLRQSFYLDVDIMPVKLVSQEMRTKNRTLWVPGEKKVIHDPSLSAPLCTEYWFHYYQHPLLAYCNHCDHVQSSFSLMYTCKPDGLIKHDTDKSGCTELTINELLPFNHRFCRREVETRFRNYVRRVKVKGYKVPEDHNLGIPPTSRLYLTTEMPLVLLKQFIEICIQEGTIR